MKIIFDNEKQKALMIRVLDCANSTCPSDFGLTDAPHKKGIGCEMDCDECWINSGLEMEVVGNE